VEKDSLATCFCKVDNCVTREIEGETIVVPVCNHVGDLDSIYVLDEVGTAIWSLLDGDNSVGHIVRSLCKEYDVGEQEATQDAIDFLTVLESSDLIRCSAVHLPADNGRP
jgi:hypothetical protein